MLPPPPRSWVGNDDGWKVRREATVYELNAVVPRQQGGKADKTFPHLPRAKQLAERYLTILINKRLGSENGPTSIGQAPLKASRLTSLF